MSSSKDIKQGRPADLAKRRAILQTAGRSFFDVGFAATSIEQVAAEAGVSKVTVYNHFGDKRGLFTAAVEAKQVAEQDAKKVLYVVDRAKQEKMAKIITAEGETAAASLIGAAVQNNPAYIELERLRAAREIAAVVARSANKVYLNADSLLLNLDNQASGAKKGTFGN